MKAISEKLKNCHLKVTPQRLAIYSMLMGTDKHPSAETIYRALEETNPTMSLATVYRTLDTLRRSGLIQEINVGEDSFRYDANNSPHAHLICTECQAVLDAPKSPAMEAMKDELARHTGFDILHEQIYFYGVCGECRQSSLQAAGRV